MKTSTGQQVSTAERLDEVMAIASCLAGRDAIGAIHVATNERLSYDQLVHYRRVAGANGLMMWVSANSIVFRPRPDDPRDAEWQSARRELAMRLGGVSTTLHAAGTRLTTAGRRLVTGSLLRNVSEWSAGFQGLTEGTR